MRLVYPIIATLLAGCATKQQMGSLADKSPPPPVEVRPVTNSVASDPIDGLVARLSASPLWMNGLFASIRLPSAATPEQVVAKVLERRVESYEIIEIREVHIKGGLQDPYKAALVKTNLGQKIVLFALLRDGIWWGRMCDT
jgi:hypothetical protein